MYAVIETGGKQYRVSPGDVVHVETLSGEAGETVEFARVLAVSTEDNQLRTGSEASSARVKATIKAQIRGDKVIVFKFKRKKQYKKTLGHRQNLTTVTISEIVY